MIGSVLVYLPGHGVVGTMEQHAIDGLVNGVAKEAGGRDDKFNDAFCVLVDAEDEPGTEPNIRRLACIDSVLIERGGFEHVSHEMVRSAHIARAKKYALRLCVVPGSAPCPFCEKVDRKYAPAQRDAWVTDTFKERFSQLCNVLGGLGSNRAAIRRAAVDILVAALSVGWKPLRGNGLTTRVLSMTLENRAVPAHGIASKLLQQNWALTIASTVDAAAFVCASEVATEDTLEKVADAFGDLLNLSATVLKGDAGRQFDRQLDYVGVRALSTAINPNPVWRSQRSRMGKYPSEGVVMLIDSSSSVARRLVRGVASAAIEFSDEDAQILLEEPDDGEFVEQEGDAPQAGISGSRVYFTSDPESVVNLLVESNRDELPWHGFVPILLGAAYHAAVEEQLRPRFDVISIDGRSAECPIAAYDRFTGLFFDRVQKRGNA